MLIDALDLVDNDGQTLTELLAAELKENPIRYLELASKYVPRNVDVTGHVHQTHEHRAVSQADERISELLTAGQSISAEKAVTH